MRVLIVARTRMRSGVCIGGVIVDSRRSVRLLPAKGNAHPLDAPYQVGSLWNLTLTAAGRITPPHSEDVRIVKGAYIKRFTARVVKGFVLDRVGAKPVPPSGLFDGCIRFTANRHGFVAPASRLPAYSTGFWRFERALHLAEDEGAARYIYTAGGRTLLDVKYVGFQQPAPRIPADAVLRFSLSRGFADDARKRCWLQLSGWFE